MAGFVVASACFQSCFLESHAAAQVVPSDAVVAEDGGWPRQIVVAPFTFTLYQPQVERFEGASIQGRAAVSVTREGNAAAEYGTITLEASGVIIDKVSELVTISNARITKGEFPAGGDGENGAAYVRALQSQFSIATLQLSLGRLEASLAVDKAIESGSREAVVNQVPRIMYSDQPAILVQIDGAPVWRSFGAGGATRVMNSRALIVMSGQSGTMYLRAMGGWDKAPALGGPFGGIQSANVRATREARRSYGTSRIRDTLRHDSYGS
jgi:hypothetical protein